MPKKNTEQAKPWVLGIGSSHNGSVCLLHGSDLVVAIQEERLVRFKRANLPAARGSLGVEYCLQYAGIRLEDLSAVGVSAIGNSPMDDITLNPQLKVKDLSLPVFQISHHRAHAVAVYATSGFNDSAILVVDGNGSPWKSMGQDEIAAVLPSQRDRFSLDDSDVCEVISMYHARNNHIVPLEKHITRIKLPRKPGMMPFFSVGRLFENVGEQIFGDGLEGAGKVMGLAPYGQPIIQPADFVRIENGECHFPDTVPARYLHNERWPLRQKEYADLAASVQSALEYVLSWLVSHLRNLSDSPDLCYTGGVALNSVANEKIIRSGVFRDVYIMPAAEDSGVSIGAAYNALWSLTGQFSGKKLQHDSVGRVYSKGEISTAATLFPEIEVHAADDIVQAAAQLLADGKIVGWYQGGSELGPRALGQRSILCDPRRADVKERLNSLIKRRESFRPFAPILPLEHVAEWFDAPAGREDSPFMLRVMPFLPGRQECVPAVVHVDGTGRVQTVTRDLNGRLYEVIKHFGYLTGVPMLLNTSFNIAGEPIVETPEDALCCFFFNQIDACILDSLLVTKMEPYKSPLEYVYTCTAAWISDEFPAEDCDLSYLSLSQAPPFRFVSYCESRLPDLDIIAKRFNLKPLYISVSTRWGKLLHATGSEMLHILRLMDGNHTGQQILEALWTRGWTCRPEDLLQRLMKLVSGSAARVLSGEETPLALSVDRSGSAASPFQ